MEAADIALPDSEAVGQRPLAGSIAAIWFNTFFGEVGLEVGSFVVREAVCRRLPPGPCTGAVLYVATGRAFLCRRGGMVGMNTLVPLTAPQWRVFFSTPCGVRPISAGT